MKSFIEKARKIHRNQKGFTLIELLVVMAILAILVGLVVPNFFGIPADADAIQIQGQHEKMREAVYLYHLDTGEWPTEWSGSAITVQQKHQLWFPDKVADDAAPKVSGWDGPYIERPILQDNRWGGHWGVYEGVNVDIDGAGDPGGFADYTVLVYYDVPLVVCRQIDAAMDDGTGINDNGQDTGAVQYDDNLTVPAWGHPDATDDSNTLIIIIAKQ